MRIVDHWLIAKGIRHIPTPNIGKSFPPGLPDTLVLHYTAMDSCQQAVNLLCSPQHKAAAHLVVARNGSLRQLVPFDTITWHAGQSEHNQRKQLNNYALGIEIDNAGHLDNRQGQFFSWQGQKYPPTETLFLTHRHEDSPCYWHRYPSKQIRLVRNICQLLMKTYPIRWIVGHEEISSHRKSDPGPAFPLDILRKQLFEE